LLIVTTSYHRAVIFQSSLAYLLGLEGIALMRAFDGDHDRDFTRARLAEIRPLLDTPEQFGDGISARPISVAEGYDVWAAIYDDEPNGLLDMDQPVVREILDGLPAGTALDAACGTGRYASYLASLGHQVIGVDISPEMLAVARAKVPGGEFLEGDLHQLPVPGQHVDLVVCALALTHVADLAPVLAEFARVLRPGGHLVIADSRLKGPVVKALPDGGYGYLPHYNRFTSEYLAAAIPLGLQVRRCEEMRADWREPAGASAPVRVLPDYPSQVWTLREWIPAASYAASSGNPILLFWDFQLADEAPEFLPLASTSDWRTLYRMPFPKQCG
jgi:ubiquinone/menaquinone biosynthesis C-methylase UbiE